MAKPRIRGADSRRNRPTDKITAAEIISCPNLITEPDHFHKNGRCRCSDKKATEMAEKGYVWTGMKWTPKWLVS